MFSSDELRLLMTIIKEEKLHRRMSNNNESTDREEIPVLEGSNEVSEIIDVILRKRFLDQKERYEMYNVDYDVFKVLFTELTPWGKCQTVDLAEKLFRLMDKRDVEYLSFEQVMLALRLICCGTSTEKLQLLYILHLPPLLTRVEIERNLRRTEKTDNSTEEAAEAELFFGDDELDPAQESLKSLPSPYELLEIAQPDLFSRQSVFYVDLPESVDGVSDISDLGLRQALAGGGGSSNFDDFSQLSVNSETTEPSSSLPKRDVVGGGKSSLCSETRSMSSIRFLVDQPTTDGDRRSLLISAKHLPNMSKAHFFALWITMIELYDKQKDDLMLWYQKTIDSNDHQQQQGRLVDVVESTRSSWNKSDEPGSSSMQRPMQSFECLSEEISKEEELVSTSSHSSMVNFSDPDNNGNVMTPKLGSDVQDEEMKMIETELASLEMEETLQPVSSPQQNQISFDVFLKYMPAGSMAAELSKETSIKERIEKLLKRKGMRSAV